MPSKKKTESKPTQSEKIVALLGNPRIIVKRGQTRQLKDLWNWPDNPNKMTNKEARDLKTSLQKFGVIDEPLIEEENMIIGGNHRAGAILELMGPEYEIPVKVIVGLTHDEKIEVGLMLNNLHGSPDSLLLKNVINTLERPEELLDLGFDTEDFKDLEISLEVFADTSIESGFEVVEKSETRMIKCPSCGHEFNKVRKVGSSTIRDRQ